MAAIKLKQKRNHSVVDARAAACRYHYHIFLWRIQSGYARPLRGRAEELLQIERGYSQIPRLGKTMDGSTSDIDCNVEAVSYLKLLQATGFQYGIFVADSKLVTHNLVMSMNDPSSKIPFVSRCPANFEEKLENRIIQKACGCDQWKELGTFHKGKSASIYRGSLLWKKSAWNPCGC